jgi:hypothetical protein
MKGTGGARSRAPVALRGLPHDDGGAVAVEHGRDDAAVQEAEAVVVLGARGELGDRELAVAVAAEVEALRVGVATPETGQIGVQRLLNAQPVGHGSNLPLAGQVSMP